MLHPNGGMMVMEAMQINLFVLFSGVAAIISAFSLYKIRTGNKAFQLELEKIRAELLSTSSGSIGVGRRLLEVEKKLLGSLSKQEEFQSGYMPYSKATEMLGTGADIGEVIKTCGISRAEAELMQLMHRQMKRCGPTTK